MRAYLWTTGVMFGVLAMLHAWRAIEEAHSLARDPWFVVITLVSAALCIWAMRLIRSARA